MRKIVLIGALMFLSPVAWAEMEIITLRHRSAEEVLPIVRPLLDKDGVASGMNYQLILRTSPHNLTEIRRLLESADVAPRRLRITVMLNVGSETARRLTEVSGSVGAGRDARASMRGSKGGGGLTVEAGRGADTVRAHVLDTRSSEEDRQTQHILVLEGSRALVSAGQSVPFQQRRVKRSPWNVRVEESTQYRDVVSGFYVLPRISGDRVTLEISAQNDTYAAGSGSPPAIRTQQVATTVSGRLGEWLELGDASRQASDDGTALSARNSADTRERRSVLLKVEETD
ncbi:MAG: hypothetical protein HZC43_04150 [Nitrosomonadales bacterium]|nr:hypothetical protein [Nitrosomonadales bacterium]